MTPEEIVARQTHLQQLLQGSFGIGDSRIVFNPAPWAL
jgi:hypothetical protein